MKSQESEWRIGSGSDPEAALGHGIKENEVGTSYDFALWGCRQQLSLEIAVVLEKGTFSPNSPTRAGLLRWSSRGRLLRNRGGAPLGTTRDS